MAIYHLTLKDISAGRGQSIVAAMAYRRGALVVNEATGERKDFSHKHHIIHTEFAVPANAPIWVTALLDLPDHLPAQKFWSQVEHYNRRLNAHYADEIEIALPREFTISENIALVRAFVADQLSARGLVADWAYHDVPDNPHVHILVQTRPLTDAGFGNVVQPNKDESGVLRRHANGKIDYKRFGLGRPDLNPIRAAWASVLNQHYASHGLDIRMDHRSFHDQGVALLPSDHIGVWATAIDKQGGISERIAHNKAIAQSNQQRVLENPELILDKLSAQRSVFTERDIAAEIFRYTNSRDAYQRVKLLIGASENLIAIRAPLYDCASNKELQPALYTTRSVFETEQRLIEGARKLAGKGAFQVPERRLRQAQLAFERQAGFALSEQQKAVLRYVTEANAVAAVVGFAGAGKSSIMHVIRQAYQARGCAVYGAALAGVAVDALKQASGIDSRTVCSWMVNWAQGKRLLKPGDVFVLDEAGMVSSSQMLAIIEQVMQADAKLILLGDHRQLQPIMSGAAFRGIADELGYRELTGIRRQRNSQHRKASLLLAKGNTTAALQLYHLLGNFTYDATPARTQNALIREWSNYFYKGQDAQILCHRNTDVDQLNAKAREALKARGALQNEFVVLTGKGRKAFAIGDRIVCLRGDWKTGLRNGTHACITDYQPATGLMTITAQHGAEIQFCVARYNAFDHGYAQTIHKSQGRTVKHALVYLTRSMDAQLTYVALTRHRCKLHLYADLEEFGDRTVLLQALSRDRLKMVCFQHSQTQDYGDALRAFMQRRNIGTEDDWRRALQKIITTWKRRLRLATVRLNDLSEKLHRSIRWRQLSLTGKISPDIARRLEHEPSFGDASTQPIEAYPAMSDKVRQVAAHLKQALDHADRVDTRNTQSSLWRTCRNAVLQGPRSESVRRYLDALGDVLLPSQAVAVGRRFDANRLESFLSCFNDKARAQLERDWPAIYYLSRAHMLVTRVDTAAVKDSDFAEQRPIETCKTSFTRKHSLDKPLIPALTFRESISDVAARLAAQDPDLGQIEKLIRKNLAQCFGNSAAVAELFISHIHARGALAPHLKRLESRPADFGDLLGKRSFPGWANRQRVLAQASLRVGLSALENYGQRFAQLTESFVTSELEFRKKMQQPVADLSPGARNFLAGVDDEKADLVGLVSTRHGKRAHTEIQAFLAQIRERFADKNLTPLESERFQRVMTMLDPCAAERLASRVRNAVSIDNRVAWQWRALHLQEHLCQQTALQQELDP